MKPCLILLVEDDSNDAFFVARALKDLGFDGRLEHVTDTDIARSFIEGAGEFADRERFPFPDIIVSDSALSGNGSGIDLLEWIRKQPAGKDLPFVILSGEVSPPVRARAETAGVHVILQKGSSFRDTEKALKTAIAAMPEHCRMWLK